MSKKTPEDNNSVGVDDQLPDLAINPFVNERKIVTEKFTIIEDGTGAVTINGFTLYGFVDGGKCDLCGGVIRIFDISYDQYFCPSCNEWREPFCKDPLCRFCSGTHPERPLPTFGVNDKTYPKRLGQGWGNMKFVTIDA